MWLKIVTCPGFAALVSSSSTSRCPRSPQRIHGIGSLQSWNIFPKWERSGRQERWISQCEVESGSFLHWRCCGNGLQIEQRSQSAITNTSRRYIWILLKTDRVISPAVWEKNTSNSGRNDAVTLKLRQFLMAKNNAVNSYWITGNCRKKVQSPSKKN